MADENTKDLTIDEKLNRILDDLADVKARLAALEAQFIRAPLTLPESLRERVKKTKIGCSGANWGSLTDADK